MKRMPTRADRHNNPAAITTDVAKQAKLKLGVDYEIGDAFPGNSKLRTARFLGDPIATTIRVIDEIGYYTRGGAPRWTYIALPKFVWQTLTPQQRRDVVLFHYQHEGGRALLPLWKEKV
jgi:hypothetical protein